jgi:hypothetical protein
MSSHLNYIPDRTICPSICIPRVFKHITVPFIIDIFQEKLKLGIIKKVDVIPNNNDKLFKKVFIHFASWHDNDHINTIKNKFIRGIVIKIVYDEPWFWKCSLNRTPTSHNRNNTSTENTENTENTSTENTSTENT